MVPRNVLSLNTRLPTKLMLRTPVDGPSLISKTRSTRFSDSWMILGSTAPPRPPPRAAPIGTPVARVVGRDLRPHALAAAKSNAARPATDRPGETATKQLAHRFDAPAPRPRGLCFSPAPKGALSDATFYS